MNNFTMNGHTNGHSSATVTINPTERFEAIEAEQSTLGAMLLEPTAADHAAELLAVNDFGREMHRIMFRVLLAQREAGEPTDVVTVCQALRVAGQLEAAGGFEYVKILLEACPSSANIHNYARAVRECSQRRQQRAAAYDVMVAAGEGDAGALATATERLQVLAEAAAATRPRFALMTAQEVADLKPGPQLIEGVLPSGKFTLMYGAYRTFKSFQALSMGLSVATGTPWHGHEVEQGHVVYVAGEGVDGIGKRITAWRFHHKAYDLSRFHMIAEAPNIREPNDVGELLAQLRRLPEPPKLVIFDTLARCMAGGDENGPVDSGAALMGFERVQRQTGATVQVICHCGKDGKFRGHTSIPGAADTMIEVRADGERVTLRCEKQKDGPEFAPLTLAQQIVGEGPGSSLVFEVTDGVPVGRTLGPNDSTALAVLRTQFPSGATQNDWRGACGDLDITRQTFLNVKRRLLEWGLVAMQGDLYVCVEDETSNVNECQI